MIVGHNDNLPKNRFKELDELEEREHLDNSDNHGGDLFRDRGINPIATLPYNGMFTFPYMNTGYLPADAPVWWVSEDNENDKNKRSGNGFTDNQGGL